ncbi:unnamed protein product [Discosporangium mesarthrocarpum]
MLSKIFPLFCVYDPEPEQVVPVADPGPSSAARGWHGEGRHPREVKESEKREEIESRLRFFRAAGRIMALSAIRGAPLGVRFPKALWSCFMGLTPTWEECCGLDEEYRRSMQAVLDHDFGSGGSMAAGNTLDLFFVVTERGPDGKLVDVPLIPGGVNTRVKNSNKLKFVTKATRRRALGGGEQAVSAMRQGLLDIIPQHLLSMLLPSELESIIGGAQHIDLGALKANVWYMDEGFNASHHVIGWLWEWVENVLDEDGRRRFLLFWSGSSRTPVFGFESNAITKDSRWAISKLESFPGAGTSCPRVATCDRRMSIPEYSSREELHKYMSIAVDYGSKGYYQA